jgi:hypothetical protein
VAELGQLLGSSMSRAAQVNAAELLEQGTRWKMDTCVTTQA